METLNLNELCYYFFVIISFGTQINRFIKQSIMKILFKLKNIITIINNYSNIITIVMELLFNTAQVQILMY